MRLQLIRSATLRLTYAGQTIIIDPDLAPKHSRSSFTGRSENPMVDLPLSVADLAEGLDGILVSHLHRDHFDAVESLPLEVPVLCQPGTEVQIAERGFSNVSPVDGSIEWNGIELHRTGGEHGTGTVGQLMGKVSGFVFRALGEPTLYWAGDTILCGAVEAAIERFRPDIIITHSCGASWPDSDGIRQLIVMDAEQTIAVCRMAPSSTIIATHMDAFDHSTVSRADLRTAATAAGIDESRLRIPADGEEIREVVRSQ